MISRLTTGRLALAATEEEASFVFRGWLGRRQKGLGSSPLTPRELECLRWCAEGKSYWDTAVILGITERTVSFHMERARNKLDAATNAHAVARAMRAGLLDWALRP